MKEEIQPKAVPPRIGEAVRPTRIEYLESPRLQRMRAFARLMDQSIVLPGGYRIGIDPIIGLVPGFGDFVATLLSLYLVYQGARLGLPKRILLRMCGNVVLEALVGEIPILGDIFDAVWKANIRNMNLVELHYRPGQPERSRRKIAVAMGVTIAAILLGVLALNIAVLWVLLALLQRLGVSF